MTAFVVAPRAQTDLRHIARYIRRDSVDAARRVIAHIQQEFEFLAQNFGVGTKRVELTGRDVRFWVSPRYPNYTVVYAPTLSPLRIVRVLHGAMDAPRQL